MTQESYLIYRQEFLSSEITPFLTTYTKKKAQEIKKKAKQYYENVYKNLPLDLKKEVVYQRSLNFVTKISNPKAKKIFNEIIKNAPYGIKYSFLDFINESHHIEIMKLPYLNE